MVIKGYSKTQLYKHSIIIGLYLLGWHPLVQGETHSFNKTCVERTNDISLVIGEGEAYESFNPELTTLKGK